MMYKREKSDLAAVARKLTNGADGPSSESVERRAGTKGNTDKTCMRRTPSRASMFAGLERVRERARREKKERFTALLHHENADRQHMTVTNGLRIRLHGGQVADCLGRMARGTSTLCNFSAAVDTDSPLILLLRCGSLTCCKRQPAFTWARPSSTVRPVARL
jgi:hypothetical protein